MLIDDLITPLAAQAVQALCRRADLRLFICVTALADQPAIAELAVELLPVALGPLEESDTARLVRSVLPSGWDSREVQQQVHQLSGGNPGLACALLGAAISSSLEPSPAPSLLEALQRAATAAELSALSRLRLQALTAAQRLAGARLALFAEGISREAFCQLFADTRNASLDGLVLQGLVVEEAELRRLRVAARPLALAFLEQAPRQQQQQDATRALAELRSARATPLAQAQLVIRGGLTETQLSLVLEAARTAQAAGDLSLSAELLGAALPAARAQPDRRQDLLRELLAVQLALGQITEAKDQVQAALDSCNPAEQPALLAALADIEQKAGRAGQALEALSRIPRAALESAPSLLLQKSSVLLFAGQIAEALDTARAVVERADHPTPAFRAEAAQLLGLAHYYQGDLSEAQQQLQSALRQLPPGDTSLLQARIINALAMVHQRQSAFAAAAACYEQALNLARAHRHLPFEATLLMNLGAVAQQRGDLAAALAHYQSSLEIAESFGGQREQAQVLHNLGRLYGYCGQEVRAQGCLARSLAICQASGWNALSAYNRLVEGELALFAGRPAEALTQIDRAQRLFAVLGDARGAAEATLARAKALLRAGSCEEAATLLEAVGEDAAQMDSIRLQLHALRGALELANPSGSPHQALGHLREALRLAEDSAEHEPLAELHGQLARAATRAGESAQARAHQASARQLLLQQAEELPAELRPLFLSTGLRRAGLEQQSDNPLERPSGSPASPERPLRGRAAALDAHLLAALLEVNKELNAEPDFKRLLERIIDHAVDLAGAERGFLIMARRSGMTVEVARNIDQETVRRKEFKISRSIAEEVLQSGRPVLAVDAMDDRRFQQFLSVHNLKLRSIVCVPLTVQRQTRGAIYLDNRFQTEAFGEQHVALIAALAEQAGLAVSHFELLEQNRERQAELQHRQEELRQLNTQLEAAMVEQRSRLEELAQLTESQRGELEQRYRFENLVGQSAALRELFRLMERIKEADAPVLIQGESGTGKELVARALHFSGARKAGPFVPVNCGALPPNLLESELFGYVRGAFTGAQREHRGLLERADGGTLFLDEVGEMPPPLQVKLLRVLQDKRFTPVGGEQEQSSDFRVIAASNQDLHELVAAGRFREDLLFRLHVIRLEIPPLRQRREDIPALIEHFLEKHQGADLQLASGALRLLMDYNWPGNVRELENEIQRMVALAGPVVQAEDLSPRIRQAVVPTTETPPDAPVHQLKEALTHYERQLVMAALKRCRGNVTLAAEQLGLTRVGLHKLLKQQRIDRFGQPLVPVSKDADPEI